MLLTHYHADHTGGVPQLAAKIPIGTFIDHGVNREPTDAATEEAWNAYQALLVKEHNKRMIAKPGEDLPIPGIETKVISADGALIEKPLPGAGAENPICNTSAPGPADRTENARSLGVLFTFGKLRILDLGDLTKDKERELMCPVNKLGKIDISWFPITDGFRATVPSLWMASRRASPSWTTALQRAVLPLYGTRSRNRLASKHFGSFTIQTKAAKRTTWLPLSLPIFQVRTRATTSN